MKAFADIDGNVVDLILDSMGLDVGHALVHGFAIDGGIFFGEHLYASAGLHIDETAGFSAETELYLVLVVDGVEEEDFVFFVAQMTE